jgi:hypothetical protein
MTVAREEAVSFRTEKALQVDLRRTSWRDLLPIHPAAEIFPMLGRDELLELGRGPSAATGSGEARRDC